jgi:acyl-ACP thioesterase
MPEPGADRLVPRPAVGRTFSASRRARFGDLDGSGRVRLDALARFLQDVSSDDTADAALRNDIAWVVRRTAIELWRSPRFRELLTLTTFCSGTGSRWAERRVSIAGERGAAIEAVSLWVHLDGADGRPQPLPDEFHEHYDQAAQGRRVSARLQHGSEVPGDVARERWPLRATDFDLLGHVNNAATWAIVEEALARRPEIGAPFRAELEYRQAIERDERVEVASADAPDGSVGLWVFGSGDAGPRLSATARVRPLVG